MLLLARRAGAKRLFLFHHDPDHNDEKVAAMVEHAQGWWAKKAKNRSWQPRARVMSSCSDGSWRSATA